MSSPSKAPTPETRARLDQLFAGLQDGGEPLAPISPAEFAQRTARLGEEISRGGLDAFLVEPGTTLTYLTGVEWAMSERLFALLVTAEGRRLWILPEFELERARETIPPQSGDRFIPWQEHEGPYPALIDCLRREGVERLALDPSLRLCFARGIEERWDPPPLLGDALLLELRGRKDDHELALLRRAGELTQQAIVAVAETLEPGIERSEIEHRLTAAQERLGLTDIWHLVLIGPAAALPHGDEVPRRLERGDLLLIDTGGKLHGYCSDNTRSWVPFGSPSLRIETLWHAVRDAQKAAFEALRPGRPCSVADRAAREALAAAGQGTGYEHFFHRLGHGIGMDGHEAPYLDGGSTVPLAPRMCFSDEPGLYFPGELGLRIEDIVTITDEGADHFGEWQAGPGSPAPA